jgi:HK97 family phage portal protein
MDYSRATWSNSEQMARQLVDFTLKPWLDAWESAYRRVLLSDDDRTGYNIEFVLDELLKGDTAARAAAYAQFRSAGVYTANEIRALENLPSRPDGDELGNPYTSATTGPTSNSPAPTTDSNNE